MHTLLSFFFLTLGLMITWDNPVRTTDGDNLPECDQRTPQQIADNVECLDKLRLEITPIGQTTQVVEVDETTTSYEISDSGLPPGTVTVSLFAITDRDISQPSTIVLTIEGIDILPVDLSSASQPGADSLQVANLLIGETGQPVTFSWPETNSDSVEIQVLPYGKDIAIASASTFDTEWQYTPNRSGLYTVRARNCDAQTVCDDWVSSDEQGLILFFKLGSPTGGGIE